MTLKIDNRTTKGNNKYSDWKGRNELSLLAEDMTVCKKSQGIYQKTSKVISDSGMSQDIRQVYKNNFISIYRWLLTYDFLTLWWYKSSTHSVETIHILNCGLFLGYQHAARSSPVILGGSQPHWSYGSTTKTLTTILFFTFSTAFNKLHEIFNTSL